MADIFNSIIHFLSGYFENPYLEQQMRLNWNLWTGFYLVCHLLKWYHIGLSFVCHISHEDDLIVPLNKYRRNHEDMHLFSIILNQEIRKLSRQVCCLITTLNDCGKFSLMSDFFNSLPIDSFLGWSLICGCLQLKISVFGLCHFIFFLPNCALTRRVTR